MEILNSEAFEYPYSHVSVITLSGSAAAYRRYNQDEVLTKKVWERTEKLSILKQLQTHFKAKHEKDVGKPFPPHYTPGYNNLFVADTAKNIPRIAGGLQSTKFVDSVISCKISLYVISTNLKL